MENSEQLVAASGHLFRIVDGRRHWVSTPPAEYLEQAAQDAKEQQDGRHV